MLISQYYQGAEAPKEWYGKADYLNRVQVPTLQQIIKEQKKTVKGMQTNFENNKLIKDFNYDLQHIITNSEEANFDYHISQIEQSISSISGKTSKEFVEEEVWMMKNGFNSLISHYQSLINHIGNLQNSNQILSALTAFDKQLSKLESLVQKYTINGIPKTGSYLIRLGWVENQLKGFVLEVEGVEFVREHVPSDIKVVQTGHVYGPTFDILGNVTGQGRSS